MQVRQAEQALTPDDLARAEAALGIELPTAMRAHDLLHDGSVPVWPKWIEKTGDDHAILLGVFIPCGCKGVHDALQSMPERTWADTDRVLSQVSCLGGEAVSTQLGEREAERRPSQRQLGGDADSDRPFVAGMDGALAQLEAQGFAYAQRGHDAHGTTFSEDLPRACPACLSKATAYMAVKRNPQSVRLPMGDALDPGQGIEFKFVAGRLREVAGVAAT